MSKQMDTKPGARANGSTKPGIFRVQTPEGPVAIQSIGQILDELVDEQGIEGLARDVARMGAVPPGPITWDLLVQRDTRLARLKALAERVRDDGDAFGFCGSSRYYGWPPDGPGFKSIVELLVGWYREPFDEYLSTSAAYSLVADVIARSMPPCRGKACVCL